MFFTRLCFFTHFDGGGQGGGREGRRAGQALWGWPAQLALIYNLSSNLNTDLTLPSDRQVLRVLLHPVRGCVS